jgi:GNAT superfamily N-acetyltransferase
VQLRKARVGDEMAVAEVHVRSWQIGYRGLVADDYLAGLRPADRAERYSFDVDDPVTVVAVTDRIRGFVTISPGVGELRALYVDPESWRAGLGAALIVEAERRLAQHHAAATLWVLTGNTRAPLLRGGGMAARRHRPARPGLRRRVGRGGLPQGVDGNLITAGPARSRPGRGRPARPAKTCVAAAGPG